MFRTLAKMLGVPFEAVEDAIKSEKLAQATLSRRGLFGGIVALVTGTVLGEVPVQLEAPALRIVILEGWVNDSARWHESDNMHAQAAYAEYAAMTHQNALEEWAAREGRVIARFQDEFLVEAFHEHE